MEMTLNLESDLSRLGNLTFENILKTLKERYERDFIYTSVRDILIAINPQKALPIYDEQTHDEYHWQAFVPSQAPHVFQVAAEAYKRLRATATNQVIIVSGESGSGKTESTKHMVRHLVHMCQKEDMQLHEKIIQINPLLEAYGNAKTSLNDNSSRFAKYLEISFKEDGQLAGAVVRDYMLEKSRVVHQNRQEGIFHIFYALFAGCPMDKREDLFLRSEQQTFRIMCSDADSLEQETIKKYKKMYMDTMDVLEKIEVKTDQVHLMLAAVLHITEIEFFEDDKGVTQIKEDAPFQHAALLLDLDKVLFGQALISSSRTVRGQGIATLKTVKQADDGRDALAKMLYERMFGWIVREINQNLHPGRGGEALGASIGILDIAGFEKLEHNSFEQMLINIVNEKLQSFMNERIFTMEMEIYDAEEIKFDDINFVNNNDILQMFTVKPGGILVILDEFSNFNQGTDIAFAMELQKKFSDHPRFEKTKVETMFGIHHFAAMVPYNAEGFIEKNRDQLNTELLSAMKESQNDFISDLFKVKRGPTGTISTTAAKFRASTRGIGGGKQKVQLKRTPQGEILANELGKTLQKSFDVVRLPNKGGFTRPVSKQTTPSKTLATFFRHSLLELLQKLELGEPFFVRCIKANGSHRANSFDDHIVSDQLTYNGLAEVAKIRKMGFAVRISYQEFISRYRSVPSFIQRSDDVKSVTNEILLSAPQCYHRDFRLGKTMVFMKKELEQHLETYLIIRHRAAARSVTRCVRRVVEIKKLEKVKREKERQKELARQERERKAREKREREIKEMERQNTNGTHDKVPAPDETDAKTLYPDETHVKVLDPYQTVPFDMEETVPKVVDFWGPGPPTAATNGKPGILKRSKRYTSSSSSGNSSPTQGSSAEEDISPDREEDEPAIDMNDIRPPTPPLKKDKEEKKHSDEPETKKQKMKFWDVPQILVRERKIRDVHEDRGLQVIKVVTYIIIFLILLWCAVAQKISLMTLVSYQYPLYENQTESQIKTRAIITTGRHLLLAIAIIIPYCLIFLTSALKWMFGSFSFPAVSTLLFSCITELLHSVGLCILTFVILPDLDIVRGIIIMNGVALIPSVFFPVCASDVKVSKKTDEDQRDKRPSHRKKFAVFCCNVLVAIVQVGFIPLILVTDNFTSTSLIDKSVSLIVVFILGMIFVSFSWWENFVDDKFCGKPPPTSFMNTTILAIKFELQEARPIVTFFTSLVKITITVLATWFTKIFKPFNESPNAEHHVIDDVTVQEAFAYLGELPLKDNAAILTLTLSAFLGYYVGYTACKLKLQKCSFNIPLILSTPVAVILALYDCGNGLFWPFTNEMHNDCKEDDSVIDRVVVCIVGFIALVSMYWLCRHIFYPDIERLAKTERLFMNPYYCSIFFEQHMILNRRRHNRKVTKNLKEDKEFFSLSARNSKLTIENEEVDDDESINPINEEGDNKSNTDVHADKYRNKKFRDIPMIYACATMWHENKLEMMQLMKSIFRMDKDQYVRRNAELFSGKKDDDFYDFEAHIFFDDAMELNDDGNMIPNQFVKLLMSVLQEACSSVYAQHMPLERPYIVPTPYGGQLIIHMPGDNFLYIHMKDKTKIRHKKRWSQVMYMYYLLGFRIVRMSQTSVETAVNEGKINDLRGWEEDGNETMNSIGRSHIFNWFEENVLRKADNTFLLALDGDVDFSPGAVKLLVDRMRKSEKVGAACGRIHPIGTGPVVWFQKFEYAIAHWLQKATEHVLGCVLCSPGCFSMFRGSALMDDNVMKKYTILPTSPVHHLMYDQGEDRWLCTLLLQQGYRVDYAAGSDAFTYAPEGFGEFFNQRRRWMPSTVFNIIDLLADYQNTVYVNSNISMLYIFYQGSLLLSTVIGPATIILMIASANLVVFQTNLIWSHVISIVPALFYFVLCFVAKPKVQIQVAEVLTGIYAFIMMIVLVGTIVTAAQSSPFHPSVMFIALLVFAFSFSAVLHPKEWTCVIFGALYFILIPTGFLLLIIYSLANLHVVSWGTREVPRKKTEEEKEKEKKDLEEKKKKKKDQGFFGRFLPQFPTKDLKEFLSKLTDTQTKKQESIPDNSETAGVLLEVKDCLKSMNDKLTEHSREPVKSTVVDIQEDDNSETSDGEPKGILRKIKYDDKPAKKQVWFFSELKPPVKAKKRDDLVNPYWAEIEEFKHGKKVSLVEEELTFWNAFIEKYLKPLEINAEKKDEDEKGLLELRSNICIGMAITNLLWIAINFMFMFTNPATISVFSESNSETGLDLEEETLGQDSSDDGPITGIEVDALGLMFVFFYLLILLIQFAGMIIHRWGTFLHLVSVTDLRNPFPVKSQKSQTKENKISTKEAINIMDHILTEPLPDYDTDSDDETKPEDEQKIRAQIEMLGKTGTRLGATVGSVNPLRASTRMLGTTNTDRMNMAVLSRSTKIINTGLKATGRTILAKDREEQLKKVQYMYRKEKDKNIDRPLPLVGKRRFNFGPGRAELEERLKPVLEKSQPRPEPRIPEDDLDPAQEQIYDQIRSQGTVGRRLGKKLRLYEKSVRFNLEDSGRSNQDDVTFQRPRSSEMY